MDLAGRYLLRIISRPSVITSFLICAFLYYILIPSLGNFSSELYSDDEISEETAKRLYELEKRKAKISSRRKSESGEDTEEVEVEDDDSTTPPINDPNEFIHGSKRYKLFEKKNLNFRKAEAFCKKMDGRLARTEKLDEMRRLQTLLQKAKLVSDDLWIGAERKVWKKHAWKEKAGPPGMDKKALEGMNAMMMGGGKQEMCPALSLSTRALAPIMCLRELPFVCEFDTVTKPKVEVKVKVKPKEKVVNKEPVKNNKKDKNKKKQKIDKKTTPKPKVKVYPKSQGKTTPKPKVYQKGQGKKATPKPKIIQQSSTTSGKGKAGKPKESKRKRDEM